MHETTNGNPIICHPLFEGGLKSRFLSFDRGYVKYVRIAPEQHANRVYPSFVIPLVKRIDIGTERVANGMYLSFAIPFGKHVNIAPERLANGMYIWFAICFHLCFILPPNCSTYLNREWNNR